MEASKNLRTKRTHVSKAWRFTCSCLDSGALERKVCLQAAISQRKWSNNQNFFVQKNVIKAFTLNIHARQHAKKTRGYKYHSWPPLQGSVVCRDPPRFFFFFSSLVQNRENCVRIIRSNNSDNNIWYLADALAHASYCYKRCQKNLQKLPRLTT